MSVETGTDSDYGLLDTRYANYFAPAPSSQIKHFADAWLGRDPDRDERVSQPVVDGISAARLHEITAAPRHYGFHATLKAPFTPARDVEATALLGDVEAFAAALSGERRTEAAAFYRKYGVSQETWHVQESADGPRVIVVTMLDEPAVSAPYFSISSCGSMPLFFDFDIVPTPS